MKILVTNEIISDGGLSFEAEFVPATEHEHDLCSEILNFCLSASHIRIEKHGDVMAARFALTIAEPQSEPQEEAVLLDNHEAEMQEISRLYNSLPAPEQQEGQAQAAEE